MCGIVIHKLKSETMNVSTSDARDCKWLTNILSLRYIELFEKESWEGIDISYLTASHHWIVKCGGNHDGVMSTTGLVTMPVPATEACPPGLASPFIHILTPPSPALAKPIVPPSRKSRFPVDFFSAWRYNPAACYGKALSILQDGCNILCHQKAGTLKKVVWLQNDALTWYCGWGGRLLAFIPAWVIHNHVWSRVLR